MLKWVLSLASVILLAGLVFSIKFGVAPKPIPLIKATEFENPKEIGVLVYRRLLQDIREQPIVIVGSLTSIPFYKEIWDGFLLVAQQDHRPFDKIYLSQGIAEPIRLKGMQIELWEGEGEQTLPHDKKIIIHGPVNWSSHFYDHSLVKRLEAERKRPILTITLNKFVVSREQLEMLQPPCPDDEDPDAPIDFTEQLNCAAERISKDHFRKKLDPDKSWMALYRFGLKDYILFVYP